MERDNLTQNKIIVLDFGGQGSHLVARRVREMQVYSEILPAGTPRHSILATEPLGIILVGEPAQNDVGQGAKLVSSLLNTAVPLLAIGNRLGQFVERNGGILEKLSSAPPVEATGGQNRIVYGLESLPTAEDRLGQASLEHFVHGICGCQRTWTMAAFIETSIRDIQLEVGDAPVVCGLSGGVDSTVAAALIYRAIGNQLHSIFVDNGFMRKHEVEEVTEIFQARFGGNFVAVDAGARFLRQVQGVTDPEEKRKRIGTEFIRVFEEEAAKVGHTEYLVQGTLYPDVVESGAGDGTLVKSHHNVGGLPEDMALKLLEPLRWLFKDEVREVAQELGLPERLVWRQPFPGPGLAVRIIGEITPTKLSILREADFILRDEIKQAGLHRDIWQYFAVLTDTKTVGVYEQQRTYGYMVGIRAVHSVDGMMASWVHLPYTVLEKISQRIMGEIRAVNRVVYDISSKPPATIEWE